MDTKYSELKLYVNQKMVEKDETRTSNYFDNGYFSAMQDVNIFIQDLESDQSYVHGNG